MPRQALPNSTEGMARRGRMNIEKSGGKNATEQNKNI